MLYLLIVKASKATEANERPSLALREAMDRYNDALVEAGVRVMAKGLHPSSEGVRLRYPHEGAAPVIVPGPFEPANSVMAGFILIEVDSAQEALDWALKMPDPVGEGEGEIELRQVY